MHPLLRFNFFNRPKSNWFTFFSIKINYHRLFLGPCRYKKYWGFCFYRHNIKDSKFIGNIKIRLKMADDV